MHSSYTVCSPTMELKIWSQISFEARSREQCENIKLGPNILDLYH